MKNFIQNDKGNFLVVTCLALMPLAGILGFAVDYSRMQGARAVFQDQTDAAAIAIAKRGLNASMNEPIEFTKKAILAELDPGIIDPNLAVKANWDGADVEVFVDGNVNHAIMSMLPGIAKQSKVSIYARARTATTTSPPGAPEIAFVDPSADNYNRLYLYCYYPQNLPDIPETVSKDYVPLQDNAEPPSSYYTKPTFTPPTCADGGYVNYYVEQMDGRYKKAPPAPITTTDGNWGSNFEYGADGEIESANGKFGMETIICKDLDECKHKKDGGRIPDRKPYRTPVEEFGACPKGGYRYHGYEDGTDNDYDDISVIMPCDGKTSGSTKTKIHLVK